MFTLYSANTPNGWKAVITLEELGLQYKLRPLNLASKEQKEDWYLSINPNGRIPALVDHDNDDFAVFESGALMIYLADLAESPLLPRMGRERSRVIQWLMFQMGGLGPMMGQANVFSRYAPTKMPWAIERYQREGRRLFEVLDRRLSETGDYLADAYSIADIANWSWARIHEWSGVDVEGLDHLQQWLERVGSRPAVQRGITISKYSNQDFHPANAVDTAKSMLV